MQPTCPPLIARVHRLLAGALTDTMAYISQLEGISNFKEMQAEYYPKR